MSVLFTKNSSEKRGVDGLLKPKLSVGSLAGMNLTYLNHSKLLLSPKRRQAALYNTALYRETDLIYKLLHTHTHTLVCIRTYAVKCPIVSF